MEKPSIFTPEFQKLLDLAKEKNTDIHTVSASIIFNVDVKDVTKKMRAQAKKINFQAAYSTKGKIGGNLPNWQNIPKPKENDQN